MSLDTAPPLSTADALAQARAAKPLSTQEALAQARGGKAALSTADALAQARSAAPTPTGRSRTESAFDALREADLPPNSNPPAPTPPAPTPPLDEGMPSLSGAMAKIPDRPRRQGVTPPPMSLDQIAASTPGTPEFDAAAARRDEAERFVQAQAQAMLRRDALAKEAAARGPDKSAGEVISDVGEAALANIPGAATQGLKDWVDPNKTFGERVLGATMPVMAATPIGQAFLAKQGGEAQIAEESRRIGLPPQVPTTAERIANAPANAVEGGFRKLGEGGAAVGRFVGRNAALDQSEEGRARGAEEGGRSGGSLAQVAVPAAAFHLAAPAIDRVGGAVDAALARRVLAESDLDPLRKLADPKLADVRARANPDAAALRDLAARSGAGWQNGRFRVGARPAVAPQDLAEATGMSGTAPTARFGREQMPMPPWMDATSRRSGAPPVDPAAQFGPEPPRPPVNSVIVPGNEVPIEPKANPYTTIDQAPAPPTPPRPTLQDVIARTEAGPEPEPAAALADAVKRTEALQRGQEKRAASVEAEQAQAKLKATSPADILANALGEPRRFGRPQPVPEPVPATQPGAIEPKPTLLPPPGEGTVPTAEEARIAAQGGPAAEALRTGRVRVPLPDGSELLVAPEQAAEAMAKGAQLVNGEGITEKPAALKEMVTARHETGPDAGTEQRTILTGDEKQTAAALAANPGAEVKPATPENVAATLAERQAPVTPEAKSPAEVPVRSETPAPERMPVEPAKAPDSGPQMARQRVATEKPIPQMTFDEYRRSQGATDEEMRPGNGSFMRMRAGQEYIHALDEAARKGEPISGEAALSYTALKNEKPTGEPIFPGRTWKTGTHPETGEPMTLTSRGEPAPEGKVIRGKFGNPAEVAPAPSSEAPKQEIQAPETPEQESAATRRFRGAPQAPKGAFYKTVKFDDGTEVQQLRMNLADIQRDPEQFQHRPADEKGITKQYRDVGKWNDKTRPLTVWRDPADGKIKLTNGHQRYGIAERAGQPDVPVTFSEAKTAAEAKTEAMWENLVGGTASPEEGARILKDLKLDTPEKVDAAFAEKGASPNAPGVREGRALAALPDTIWSEYLKGEKATGHDEKHYIALGDAVRDAKLNVDQTLELANQIDEAKGKIKPRDYADVGRRVKFAEQGAGGGTGGGLFSMDMATAKSLYAKEVEIENKVLADIGAPRSYRNLGNKAGDIEARGIGRISPAVAKAEAARAKAIYDLAEPMLKGSARHPLHDIITDVARQVAAGKLSDAEAIPTARDRVLDWLRNDRTTKAAMDEAEGRAPLFGSGPKTVQTGEGALPPVEPPPAPKFRGKGGGLSRGEGGPEGGAMRMPTGQEMWEGLKEFAGGPKSMMSKIGDVVNQGVHDGFFAAVDPGALDTSPHPASWLDRPVSETKVGTMLEKARSAVYDRPIDKFGRTFVDVVEGPRGGEGEKRWMQNRTRPRVEAMAKALDGVKPETLDAIRTWARKSKTSPDTPFPTGLSEEQTKAVKYALAQFSGPVRAKMVQVGALSPNAYEEYERFLPIRYEEFENATGASGFRQRSAKLYPAETAHDGWGVKVRLPEADAAKAVGDHAPDILKSINDKSGNPETLVKFSTPQGRDEFVANLDHVFGDKPGSAKGLISESFDKFNPEQWGLHEIKDPVRLLKIGLREAGDRIAKATVLKQISEMGDEKGKFVLDPRSAEAMRAARPENTAAGAESDYTKMEGKGWYHLDGKLVRNDIREALMQTLGKAGEVSGKDAWYLHVAHTMEGALSVYKEAHVVWNPSMALRHAATGASELTYMGLDPMNPENAPRIAKLHAMVQEGGKYHQDVVRAGYDHAGGQISPEEYAGIDAKKGWHAARVGRAALSLGASEGGPQAIVQDVAKRFGKNIDLKGPEAKEAYLAARDRMASVVFGPLVEARKLGYAHLRETGLSDAAARARVEALTIDPAKMSDAVKVASNIAAPWLRFHAQAAKVGVNAARLNPAGFAVERLRTGIMQAAVLSGLAALGKSLNLTDDEKKAIENEAPGSLVIGRDDAGKPMLVDMRHFDMLGSSPLFSGREKGGDVDQGIAGKAWDFVKDKTSLGENPVGDVAKSFGKDAEDRYHRPTNPAREWLRNFTPNLTPGVGWDARKLAAAFEGEQAAPPTSKWTPGSQRQSIPQALADVALGVKERSFDADYEKAKVAHEFESEFGYGRKFRGTQEGADALKARVDALERAGQDARRRFSFAPQEVK